MLALMSKLFKSPKEILTVFKVLVEKEASNDEQRNMLSETLAGLLSTPEAVFDVNNPLFDSVVCEYIKRKP